MKKSQNTFETTITLDKNTRDILKKIKNTNKFKTYNEVILNLLTAEKGIVSKDYNIITKPRTALCLESLILDSNGVQIKSEKLPILYSDLRESDVGKVYGLTKPAAEYYLHQTAEIIFKDSDLILLKIQVEIKQDQLDKHTELLGVELL